MSSAIGWPHTKIELIGAVASSADVLSPRYPEPALCLTLAALLGLVGCLRNQRGTSDPGEPSSDSTDSRGKVRGKLEGKAFCALGRLDDEFPVDLALDLPTGPDAQLEALAVRVEAVAASANGQVSTTWKLNRNTCVVEQSELFFNGQARGQARLTLEVDNDVTIEQLKWTTGWNHVTIPVGAIPLFVSYELGLDVDGEVRAQEPVRLIVEGRGEIAGKLGLVQTGIEITLDPPETFDIELEPRIEASADFAMDLNPVPWIDVRLFGVVGLRLRVPTDIAIVCTAMADPSKRRCTADYAVAPTIQPLIGATAFEPIWAGPVVPLPLPPNLRTGTVELPISLPSR